MCVLGGGGVGGSAHADPKVKEGPQSSCYFKTIGYVLSNVLEQKLRALLS